MQKTLTSLVSLGFIGALAIGLVNCGGTGGEPDFGNQFVNTSCNPNSDCLQLSTPSAMPVGTERSFSARLVDGSGVPLSGIQLCFEVEGGGGSIVEPAGGCGITNGNGVVSGVVRAETEGSHQFTARAPSGFGLVTRNGIRFFEGDLDVTISCAPTAINDGGFSSCTATVTTGGVPFEGQTVNFEVVPSNQTKASLSRTSGETDSSGQVEVTMFTTDNGCGDGGASVQVRANSSGVDAFSQTIVITNDEGDCPPPP